MAVEPRQIGVVNVAFTFAEANQTLGGLRTRVVLLETLLNGRMTPLTQVYLATALRETSEAEGRLSAALMGDPDLAAGDHFAGMPPRPPLDFGEQIADVSGHGHRIRDEMKRPRRLGGEDGNEPAGPPPEDGE